MNRKHLEKGQGLTEYALIFALVVLVVIVLLWIFGDRLGQVYSEIIEVVSNFPLIHS